MGMIGGGAIEDGKTKAIEQSVWSLGSETMMKGSFGARSMMKGSFGSEICKYAMELWVCGALHRKRL
ncbi:WIAG-tail domain [Sesbania bispinosa]|nr:WIAG-tail domain [Sesbania bispinosa]